MEQYCDAANPPLWQNDRPQQLHNNYVIRGPVPPLVTVDLPPLLTGDSLRMSAVSLPEFENLISVWRGKNSSAGLTYWYSGATLVSMPDNTSTAPVTNTVAFKEW